MDLFSWWPFLVTESGLIYKPFPISEMPFARRWKNGLHRFLNTHERGNLAENAMSGKAELPRFRGMNFLDIGGNIFYYVRNEKYLSGSGISCFPFYMKGKR